MKLCKDLSVVFEMTFVHLTCLDVYFSGDTTLDTAINKSKVALVSNQRYGERHESL